MCEGGPTYTYIAREGMLLGDTRGDCSVLESSYSLYWRGEESGTHEALMHEFQSLAQRVCLIL